MGLGTRPPPLLWRRSRGRGLELLPVVSVNFRSCAVRRRRVLGAGGGACAVGPVGGPGGVLGVPTGPGGEGPVAWGSL